MGWFIVTVALPVLAPMISLICMKAFPLAIPSAQLALVKLVRDGQLCWAAIGFCTRRFTSWPRHVRQAQLWPQAPKAI